MKEAATLLFGISYFGETPCEGSPGLKLKTWAEGKYGVPGGKWVDKAARERNE